MTIEELEKQYEMALLEKAIEFVNTGNIKKAGQCNKMRSQMRNLRDPAKPKKKPAKSDSTDKKSDVIEFDSEMDPLEYYEGLKVAVTVEEKQWLRDGIFCSSADVKDQLEIARQGVTNLKDRGILNYEQEGPGKGCDYYRWSVILRKYKVVDQIAKAKKVSLK